MSYNVGKFIDINKELQKTGAQTFAPYKQQMTSGGENYIQIVLLSFKDI